MLEPFRGFGVLAWRYLLSLRVFSCIIGVWVILVCRAAGWASGFWGFRAFAVWVFGVLCLGLYGRKEIGLWAGGFVTWLLLTSVLVGFGVACIFWVICPGCLCVWCYFSLFAGFGFF